MRNKTKKEPAVAKMYFFQTGQREGSGEADVELCDNGSSVYPWEKKRPERNRAMLGKEEGALRASPSQAGRP